MNSTRTETLIDYDSYDMTPRERFLYFLFAAFCIFVVGMIFYQHLVLAGLLSVFAVFYPNIRRKQIIKKRKRELNMQFKDMLYALASSMTAGRSLEAALHDAVQDLAVLYSDPDTLILVEIRYMIRLLETNVTVEDTIEQFAARTHLEDIRNFAEVIRICKRSGGNLIDVIRSTSSMIGDKIETKNEIETAITAKKFESRIMSMTPIAMVAILSATSPDYMYPVFHSGIGHFIMTIAVLFFVIAFFVGERIMDIEV